MTRFLLTLTLSLFSYSLIALEATAELPIAAHLHKTSLSNGISVYIQEHPSEEQWGSFRVVFSKPSSGQTLYVFESKTAEWDAVNDFFLTCTEKASIGDDSSYLTGQTPQEMAVIAVGHFPSSSMLELIREYFEKIDLKSSGTESIHYSSQINRVAINITQPNQYPSIHTAADLKECWKSLFLQDLLQQRLEECIQDAGEIWIHPHPQYFYPVPGFALVQEDQTETTLALLLWHLEVIKTQGFYREAFVAQKKPPPSQTSLFKRLWEIP